jgi:hypothetical protein
MKKYPVVVVLALVLALAVSSVALAAYQHQDDARIKTVYYWDANGDGVKQLDESYYTWGSMGAAWVCEAGSSTNCRNNFDEGDHPVGGSTTFTKLKANTQHVVGVCWYNVRSGNCVSSVRSASVTTGAAGSTVTVNVPVPGYSGE